MACRLIGAKPLFEPKLEYYQLYNLQWIFFFYQNWYIFHSRKSVWKCRLKNGGQFVMDIPTMNTNMIIRRTIIPAFHQCYHHHESSFSLFMPSADFPGEIVVGSNSGINYHLAMLLVSLDVWLYLRNEHLYIFQNHLGSCMSISSCHEPM